MLYHTTLHYNMSEAVANTNNTTTFEIKRAKYNRKYRNEKRGGNRPRVNNADLRALRHMVEGLPIEVEYNKKTNDIKFIVSHDGVSDSSVHKSIEIDGYDTGGQAIRTMLGLAVSVAVSTGNTVQHAPFTCGSVGKANLLYVQMASNIIPEHSQFTVIDGNPYNSDAPKPRDFDRLFEVVRKVYGVDFKLLDETGPWADHMNRYTLVRGADVPINANDGIIDLVVDSHIADQLLMTHIFHRDKVRSKINITINNYDEDYHVDAMVKIMTALNIVYTDITINGDRIIVL